MEVIALVVGLGAGFAVGWSVHMEQTETAENHRVERDRDRMLQSRIVPQSMSREGDPCPRVDTEFGCPYSAHPHRIGDHLTGARTA